MIPIDLSGQAALVTGVADDGGFGWSIAKTLQAAGARVFLASHPRTVGIVERLLRRPQSAPDRALPFGVAGELAPEAILPCDVSYDTASDVPEEIRAHKGYRDCDSSIAGCFRALEEQLGGAPLSILIHAVAFSPEIDRPHHQTSRAAYLTAMSVSSYSLLALARAAAPLMKNGSVIGLSYLASTRVVPGYGGGMSAAKAALECDARILAHFLGESGHRVNIVSPGPFPSRAARSIGAIDEMIEHVRQLSPLKKAIDAQDVANMVLFLASPLAGSISGELIHVDAGYHAMAG
ncbi:MAG: SDR family oxidoreductase [Deltaproteobacteria bacterium]|nr:SDR family oxidoreductase [Deltaproteobacteria bacterium]